MNEAGFYDKYYKKDGSKYFCTMCSKSVGDRPFPNSGRYGGIIKHMRTSHNISHKRNNEQVEIAPLREATEDQGEAAHQLDVNVQERVEAGNQLKQSDEQLKSTIAMLHEELFSKDEQLNQLHHKLSMQTIISHILELGNKNPINIYDILSLGSESPITLESTKEDAEKAYGRLMSITDHFSNDAHSIISVLRFDHTWPAYWS
jgi:predicted RNase H-like nuclease (RuvC/YqgF family)